MNVFEIEQHLGLSLPQTYKSIMESYPDNLHTQGFRVGGEIERLADYQFLSSFDRVFELNTTIRESISHLPKEEQFDIWPSFMFAIGELGKDIFAIQCKGDDDEVFKWNSYERSFEKLANSIKDFIAMLVQKVRESENGVSL